MRYKLVVLAGAISYGILSTIVTKAYGQGFTLGQVVGSQLLTGFVLVWAFAFLMNGRSRRTGSGNQRNGQEGSRMKLNGKQRLLLLAAGIPTGITGVLYYQSLHYVSNALAILLLFQFTWIGVLIQTVMQKKRPNKTTLLTLAVLLGGTLLAAGVLEQGLTRFNWAGVLFGLGAACSYSLFVLFSGRAVPDAIPSYRSGWMVTGAMLITFVLFPPTFLFDGTLWNGLLPYGLLLGFFGAFLPPVLFAIGVPRIGEGLAGILGASELPVAVFLSAFVLHEHVSPVQWGGVVIVLVGVALPEIMKRVLKQRYASNE